MPHFKSLALAPLLALSTGAAVAADLTPAPQPTAPFEGWVFTLGVGPEVLTAFPGSRAVTIWPTGTFAYQRPNAPPPFTSPDDGLSLALLDLNWLKAGPVGRVVPQRGLSNGNGAFFGLPNVDTTVELGGFLELWLSDNLRTRLEVRQGVNGHQGLDANVEIDAVERYGPFTFALGPRLALGDDQYMRAYFSVTPAEAIANGKIYPYHAYGGVTSFGGFGSIKYQFTPAWGATLFGGYDRLMNSAAASPIPNRLGSLNEFSAGVIVSYSFSLSSVLGALGL